MYCHTGCTGFVERYLNLEGGDLASHLAVVEGERSERSMKVATKVRAER